MTAAHGPTNPDTVIETMRTRGRLTSWNEEKAFGFITPNTGGNRVFVHITAFRNRRQRPAVNQILTYALSTDSQGRPCAVRVIAAGHPLVRILTACLHALPFIGSAAFLTLVGLAASVSRVPPHLMWLYSVLSLLSFVIYWADKRAAKQNSWRTPESRLHILALLGGWPGALAAQRTFRHKVSKTSFQIPFWITVILNCGAFIWLLTPEGAAALQSLIARIPPH